MSAVSTDRKRTVHLRCIRDDAELDPTARAHDARGDAPPDLERDYRAISLAEVLALDLSRARVVLEPSYYCDLRCRFCDLPIDDRTAVDFSQWRHVLQLLALSGARRLVLTGGEPGIYPGIQGLLRDLSRMGYHVGMLSHGLWATNRGHLDALLDAGLRELDVSLKASDPRVFAELTGKNRGERQRRALEAISDTHGRGRLASFRINHVLTASTLPGLADLAWLGELPGRPVVTITLCEPYRADMIEDVPTGEELARSLAPALDHLSRAGLVVRTEGIPACYLREQDRVASRDASRVDNRSPRITISPRGTAGDYLMVHFGYQRYLQFHQPAACHGCPLSGRCLGVHKKLTERVPPRPAECA